MSGINSTRTVANIGAASAISYHANGVPIIDVREDDEWRAGHIPGARHVPLDQLAPERVPATGPFLVICRSGGRSAAAARLLANAGYEVTNVVGGMTAWGANKGPMEAGTGRPPVVA